MADITTLTPLPVEELDASLAHIIDDMNGMPINVHRLMAHHPDLLKAWWSFRNYGVTGGDLGRRNGELVILRIALHMRAWYEWASHVQRAQGCGITLEEIERVIQGTSAPGWEASEVLLLQAVDELVENRSIAPDTLKELGKYFSARQLMDIMAIHGMYATLAGMANTWNLELDAKVESALPKTVTEDDFQAALPAEH